MKPQAPLTTAPKQDPPASHPAQQPAKAVTSPQSQSPVNTQPTAQQKAPISAAGESALHTTGAWAVDKSKSLTVSALRVFEGLKRGAADGVEGLLLRARALWTHNFPSLPRALQVLLDFRCPTHSQICCLTSIVLLCYTHICFLTSIVLLCNT